MAIAEYLLSYLRGAKRIGYFPETAYWVAFDISVPLYLPLYIRSRWLDLSQVRAAVPNQPPLPEHIQFSSGWEWGYWQNDYVTLRMSYTLPGDYTDPVREMFAPLGDLGVDIVGQIHQLAELQHQALIVQRLAPYFAGRDLSMDVGRTAGIISQPDRPTFAEIAADAPDARASFNSGVLLPLASSADALDAFTQNLSGYAGRSAWLDEIIDGAAINAVRARYIHALYQAAATSADHAPVDSWLSRADALFDSASAIVARRHGHLHDSQAARLLGDGENATLYQWGYLKQADTLCYWDRERIDLRNLLFKSNDPVPSCLF